MNPKRKLKKLGHRPTTTTHTEDTNSSADTHERGLQSKSTPYSCNQHISEGTAFTLKGKGLCFRTFPSYGKITAVFGAALCTCDQFHQATPSILAAGVGIHLVLFYNQ